MALAVLIIVVGLVTGGLAWRDRGTSPVSSDDRRTAPTTDEPIDRVPSTATTIDLGPAARPLETGPLTARGGHSVVWTGSEVIVWGGWGDEMGSTKHADGAAYQPDTANWRMIAPSPLSPRRNHAAAWTGEEMIVVGGDGRRDGAAYDPATDSWRALTDAPFEIGLFETDHREESHVYVDGGMIVWQSPFDRLARYDVSTDEWSQLPATGLRELQNGALRVAGDRLYALGTGPGYSGVPLQTASADMRVSSGWQRLDDAQFALQASAQGSVVPNVDPQWSGQTDGQLVAWSISNPNAALALDPSSGAWTQLGPHNLTSCEGASGPVEIEGRLLVTSCQRTTLYDPATDSWNEIPLGSLSADPRYAIWTGSQVIVWGETCCYGTAGAPFHPNFAWSFSPPDP